MSDSLSQQRTPRASSYARGEGRDAILVAAYELMMNERMSSVSHRNVAARAGVAVGLIRYHFSTRTALLLDCLKRLMAERHDGALNAIDQCHPDMDVVECGRLAVAVYTGPDTSDGGLTSTLAALLDSAREDRQLSDLLIAERPLVEQDLKALLTACGWPNVKVALIAYIIDGALVAGIVDKQQDLLDHAARSCAEVLSLIPRP